MSDHIDRWAAGDDYGPVLTPLEIYVLGCKLEVNPVLQEATKSKKINLAFDLAAGQFDAAMKTEDIEYIQDQPATLPRTTELILMTRVTPWVHVILANGPFVTVWEVLRQLSSALVDVQISQSELDSLPPRVAASITRQQGNQMYGAGYYNHPNTPHTPHTGTPAGPIFVPRFQWLLGRHFWSHMETADQYTEKRLGYKAANIFVVDLLS